MTVPEYLIRKGSSRVPKLDVKDFKADMENLGAQIAEGFKEQVIENIKKNKYKFRLADSTVKQKGSGVPLINSGELIGAIYRDDAVVSVNDDPHAKSGLTNKQLAQVQEYGTKDKHIPARPIWRNTFKDYKKSSKEQIADFFKTEQFKKPKEVEVPPIKKHND